jgi:hypothetical protein
MEVCGCEMWIRQVIGREASRCVSRSYLLRRFPGCHSRKMTKALLIAAAMCLCVSATAQDKGYWRAASSNANQITGDIAISDTKLTINFLSYSLAQIRKLTPAEAGATFDVDVNAAGGGSLYRLSVPGDKRFLHHNTLCGSEETQWIATYAEGRALHVALFSGGAMPVFTGEALANSTDVCGIFSYER